MLLSWPRSISALSPLPTKLETISGLRPQRGRNINILFRVFGLGLWLPVVEGLRFGFVFFVGLRFLSLGYNILVTVC